MSKLKLVTIMYFVMYDYVLGGYLFQVDNICYFDNNKYEDDVLIPENSSLFFLFFFLSYD